MKDKSNIIEKVYKGDTVYVSGNGAVVDTDDDGRERVWVRVRTSSGDEIYCIASAYYFKFFNFF